MLSSENVIVSLQIDFCTFQPGFGVHYYYFLNFNGITPIKIL